MQVKFEFKEPIIINEGNIFLHYPIATFETFEDLHEFLENVEINNGYQIQVEKHKVNNQLYKIEIIKKIKPKFIIKD